MYMHYRGDEVVCCVQGGPAHPHSGHSGRLLHYNSPSPAPGRGAVWTGHTTEHPPTHAMDDNSGIEQLLL